MKPFYLATTLVLLFISAQSIADDKAELHQLLDNFLANAVEDDLKNHDNFWAEDLIYTSSNGTRFNKKFILDGIKADERSESTTKASVPTYWAEDTDIRTYGTTAIVAFKLAAKWQEDGKEKRQYYFNTGTLLKRAGKWQVVAWQATKIPQTD